MQSDTPAKLPNPLAAAEWLATIYATDAIQLAALRRKIGPEGDLRAAFRQRYEAHMREHDQALIAMLKSPPPVSEEVGDAL